ncbi:MAG: DNA-processing protein DprA [Candidatus Buchananbacteria bacterium]|jgi:DNA processing protein
MDLKYWLALNKIPEFGPIKFHKILEFFDDIESAWQANLPELMAAGICEKDAQLIIINRSKINPDEELENLEKSGIKAITIRDNDYPINLKELFDAPAIIYYRGNINSLNRPCLAVVGARKHTAYGQAAAEKIVPPLASAGITIVSGLALGIDAIAHKSAIKAKGLTVAVFGSDLSWQNIGPKTNFKLAEEIIETGGCLISEYSVPTVANKQTFPQRNRIVSGLSRGVLVIEAGEYSGSLITATCALEQNRDIFAVPDSIFSPYSAGANNLIKKGAKPVTTADDILGDWLCQETLKLDKNESLAPADELEKAVIDALFFEPLHLDKLCEVCQIRINVLASKLMLMELKGQVKCSNGKYFKMQ